MDHYGAGTFGYQLGIKDANVASAVMVGAERVGGWVGERYHRRTDSVVARTRPGAVAQPRRMARAR